MAVWKLRRSESFRSARIVGRKQAVVVNGMEESNVCSPCSTPSRKRCDRKPPAERTSHLESLPLDLLVKILCKANHGDLKQLFLVSKFVNEATSIAKESHFAYSTPLSKRVFDKEFEDSGEIQNAPRQYRVAKSRINDDKLGSIAIALFTGDD